MRRFLVLFLAVLLLLCLASCDDMPKLEGGTAATNNNQESTTAESDTPSDNGTEDETKSSVSWTPFV